MRLLPGVISMAALVLGLSSFGCNVSDSTPADRDPGDAEVAGEDLDTDLSVPDADTSTVDVDTISCNSVANCAGRACGPDGCGGSCGTCADLWDSCVEGQCLCISSCEGKVCGPDGCGGECGYCEGTCSANGTECEFRECDCAGRECGYDNCAMACGTCNEGEHCDSAGVCVPNKPGGPCGPIFDCLSLCATDDKSCQQICIGQDGVAAEMAFNQMLACLVANDYFGCLPQDIPCLVEASEGCEAEHAACFHGTATCKSIFDCVSACPSMESTCAVSCRVAGTVEAQNAFEAVLDCLQGACPDDFSPECASAELAGACKDVYNTCIAN